MEDRVDDNLRANILSALVKPKAKENKPEGEQKGLLEKCLEHQLNEKIEPLDESFRKEVMESINFKAMGKMFNKK
jgi:hypothetical protein